ncbi:MAG: LysR substrate-binding domain-containing protein [Saprospiraceae bacterium]
MNFQQLEYIIEVERTRHFAEAAKNCFVTQPTLSMMIKKLEQELGVMIFDRKQKPIAPTQQGKKIIEHAKAILKQKNQLLQAVQEEKETLEGDLRLGIIPTIAPYLIPLFIKKLTTNSPQINIIAEEINTSMIIDKLKNGQLDIGILATPLEEENIEEIPIFYEEFFLYGSTDFDKKFILPEDINLNQLLLLEEGHCLRSQVLNLCHLKEKLKSNFSYKSGSLETLKRLVEKNQGITILPELATRGIDKKRIIQFGHPRPVREVSLVVHKSFIKKKMLDTLFEEIRNSLPKKLKENSKKFVVKI